MNTWHGYKLYNLTKMYENDANLPNIEYIQS